MHLRCGEIRRFTVSEIALCAVKCPQAGVKFAPLGQVVENFASQN